MKKVDISVKLDDNGENQIHNLSEIEDEKEIKEKKIWWYCWWN